MLGGALLAAPWLSSFRNENGSRWTPQSSRFGYCLLVPLALLYICANAFVLVFSFYPPDRQPNVDRSHQILSALIGPTAGHCVLAFGAAWWCWDRYLLPRLGYEFEVTEEKVYSEQWGADVLEINYSVGEPLARNPLHQLAFLGEGNLLEKITDTILFRESGRPCKLGGVVAKGTVKNLAYRYNIQYLPAQTKQW